MSHTFFQPGDDLLGRCQRGETLLIEGDEAAHAARVKRLIEGEVVRVCDGAGTIAQASVLETRKAGRDRWSLRLAPRNAHLLPRPTPRLEVYAALPKIDLLEYMVDQLSQAGACVVVPLVCARSIETAIKPTKRARLERINEESLKQCGRAWLMELGEPATIAEALAHTEGARTILAHGEGDHWPMQSPDATCVRLLIGPKGGFSPEEITLARRSGAMVAKLGPNTLRIETAAVVATGLVRAR